MPLLASCSCFGNPTTLALVKGDVCRYIHKLSTVWVLQLRLHDALLLLLQNVGWQEGGDAMLLRHSSVQDHPAEMHSACHICHTGTAAMLLGIAP